MTTPAPSHSGLSFEPHFATPGTSPFDEIEWEHRTAKITDDSGKALFHQENVEVPKSWSELATKIVSSKYFYGEPNTPERETSVRQVIHRVARTIADLRGSGSIELADVAEAASFRPTVPC